MKQVINVTNGRDRLSLGYLDVKKDGHLSVSGESVGKLGVINSAGKDEIVFYPVKNKFIFAEEVNSIAFIMFSNEAGFEQESLFYHRS